MEPSRPTAGVITFGGNIRHTPTGDNSLYFTPGGTATSIAANVYGTIAIVGVRSYPFAVTWDTASGRPNTTLQLIRQGHPVAEIKFLMDGATGSSDIETPFIFEPGNNIQLKYVSGTVPGPSVVSFYMTPA
jgi:hypothetical protein